MGKHSLGSHGYLGKRPIWDKEDAEREAAGLPDPFTNPLEHDFIRSRYKWDKEKKVFYTNKITRKLIRLLEKQHCLAAESPTSPMRPKWDTPLNWALNELKGLPLD